MNEVRRRLPTWKILGSLGAILILLAGALWLWIESVAARRWLSMEQRVRRLVEETRSRDFRRVVLNGEAEPGNAWEDYARALDELRRLKPGPIDGNTQGISGNYLPGSKAALTHVPASRFVDVDRFAFFHDDPEGLERALIQLPLQDFGAHVQTPIAN